MIAWQKYLNRRHLHILVLAIVALSIIAPLVLAAASLRQYFFWGTNFTVAFVGRDAVLKFNLQDSDQKNLTKLTNQLGLDWHGEDLSVELSPFDIGKWQNLLPPNSKLTFPSGSEMILHATAHTLPLSPIARIGSEDRFIPPDAVGIISSNELGKIYNLPGKEVFTNVSGRPTLAFFYLGGNLSFVFVSSVKDKAELDGKLSTLKNNSGSPVLGYSSEEGVATGFNETDVDGIKTYTLTRPDLKYQPTFGDVGGKLVVASSPEAWQAAELAYQSGKSIGTNAKYKNALAAAPKLGAGFFYLDLTALAGRGSKITSDLAPFGKLAIDDSWLASGVDIGKLDYLESAWFGLDPASTGVGQSELWIRLKTR
jgi:hypothetical protein